MSVLRVVRRFCVGESGEDVLGGMGLDRGVSLETDGKEFSVGESIGPIDGEWEDS